MARKKQRLFTEYLNSNFGFFYTVKKRLRKARTGFQEIELVDTEEFGRVLLLDRITQVVEKNDYQYHEPMVHPAVCAHPGPRELLVIGGGDGGILREALKYRCVRHIAFAELDGKVVSFCRRFLPSVHGGAFDDPRVGITITDGRSFVEKSPRRFDVVIMDMTDPFGPSRMLYTREFFRAVHRSFRNENGIFVMHSESPVARPDAFTSIHTTLRSVFRHVHHLYLYIQMYAVLWSIAVCSNRIDIGAMSERAVDGRLRRRGIRGLQVYNGHTHRAMGTAFPYIERIVRTRGRLITDRDPVFPDHFEG